MPCRRWNSKALSPPGHLGDRGDGQRVVRGELRIEARARGEQPLGAGEIAEIGRRLAREDREVRQPALLRALDLRVPVGALDEPHHQPPARRGGSLRKPVDHRRRALLVGLHGEPEPVPAGERRLAQEPREDVERELQPVRLLRVDGEVQVVRLGGAAELDQPRHQLGQHARSLPRDIARMQRRELDRDARPPRQRAFGARCRSPRWRARRTSK